MFFDNHILRYDPTTTEFKDYDYKPFDAPDFVNPLGQDALHINSMSCYDMND